MSAFGSSTVVSALSCFLIGVKDKSRMVLAGSPWHIIILVVTSVSLAVDVNAYVYIVGALSKSFGGGSIQKLSPKSF